MKTSQLKKLSGGIIFHAVCLLTLSLPVFAVNLTEYRENIVHLNDDLSLMISPEEDSTTEEISKFEREVLAEFPKLLPARDRLEWNDSTIEINNQWIYAALERFGKESSGSPKRTQILIEISERLSALEQKLDELENATNPAAKDEINQKLAEILRREEYARTKETEESLAEKIYRQLLEWFAKIFPRSNFPAPANGNGLQSLAFILQIVLYALIFGAIGFLLYRFAPFLYKRFQNKNAAGKKERVILGERLAADETPENLFTEAERLASEGDWRGAIRKGYIALLCELSERKIVSLSKHKTNRDYLREVRQQNDLYKNMRGLTENYERNWYGFGSAKDEDWEAFRSAYQNTVKSH